MKNVSIGDEDRQFSADKEKKLENVKIWMRPLAMNEIIANVQLPNAINFFNTNVIEEILIWGSIGQLSYKSASGVISIKINTSNNAMKIQRQYLLTNR